MASQYVGIDLHRQRSVIVRQNADGEVLEEIRIDNDPVALALAVEKARPHPEVVVEATYGWYWAVDVLRMNRLPEAWIAPPYLRQLRELVRYRAKLVALRSGLKAQVHAVLASAYPNNFAWDPVFGGAAAYYEQYRC